MDVKHTLMIIATVAAMSLAQIGKQAIADDSVPSFELAAILKAPEEGNLGLVLFSRCEPFRSAVLRFPWVYVLTRGTGPSQTATLCIFKLPSKGTNQELKPLEVIKNVGDGQNLMRWDNFLVCTWYGSLEVYSLDDPQKPKRLSRCEPSSKATYLTKSIVRDGTRAFVIGDGILLSYDLSDPSKPKLLGEAAIKYNGSAGCMSGRHLYAGASPKEKSGKSPGVAVFDITDPAKPKELGFLPLPHSVWHLFPVSGNRLLASLDADSHFRIVLSNNITVNGTAVLIDITQPTQPVLMKELPQSGGRASTLLSTSHGEYFVCEGVVFLLRDQQLDRAYSFFPPGSTLDGFPYHGDSDGTHAVLPLDDSAVVLRIPRK